MIWYDIKSCYIYDSECLKLHHLISDETNWHEMNLLDIRCKYTYIHTQTPTLIGLYFNTYKWSFDNLWGIQKGSETPKWIYKQNKDFKGHHLNICQFREGQQKDDKGKVCQVAKKVQLPPTRHISLSCSAKKE